MGMPHRTDSIEPWMRDAAPEIQALFAEIKTTRQDQLDFRVETKRVMNELRAEIRRGFDDIKKHCKGRAGKCDAEFEKIDEKRGTNTDMVRDRLDTSERVHDKRFDNIEKEIEINKIKTGLVIGGAGAGGGFLWFLADKLYHILRTSN